MDVQLYWENFLHKHNLSPNINYFEVFYFGADKTSAQNLLNLVLAGKKTATSSAQEEYTLNNEREPTVNDYSIVTDFEGIPKCIIQTTDVIKLKFEDMTYDLCQLEGEDLNLKTWQDKHIEFFNTVGEQAGYKFKWDMTVVFEKFKVVHK